MVHFENYEMLPRQHKLAVMRMVRAMNGGYYTMEMLAHEAIIYRRMRGWFVWEWDEGDDVPEMPATPPRSEETVTSPVTK